MKIMLKMNKNYVKKQHKEVVNEIVEISQSQISNYLITILIYVLYKSIHQEHKVTGIYVQYITFEDVMYYV